MFATYTWYEARSYCANNSAYLVDELDSFKSTYLDGIVNNLFPNIHFLYVFAVMDSGIEFWLGLNERANDGIYVWDRPDGVDPLPVSWAEYAVHSLTFFYMIINSFDLR